MVNLTVTPFTLYNLAMGLVSAVGIVYLLYTQLSAARYRRFLYVLGAGLLVFAVGGPVADLLVPDWTHLVHGIAALFVAFGLYDPVHNELRKDEWIELLYRDPGRVRHPRAWMRPIDERILKLFHSSDLVLTPTIIAYNIEYSTKEVNRRLTELTDHGFVDRVERGKYQMTALGEQYLEGNFGSDHGNQQPATDLTNG